MNRKQLTELFAELGATEPQDWAASQIDEGIPQLHRFVFLRQAWQSVLSSDNADWVDNIRNASSRGEGEAGDAVERLLSAGGAAKDLTEVIRFMQRDLLFSLCYQLDDPGGVEPEVEGINWGLFAIDEDGQPTGQMLALHESVIETDPETSGSATA